MKCREEAHSRSHKSVQTAKQSHTMPLAPTEKATCSLISNSMNRPTPTSLPTSTTLSMEHIRRSRITDPRRYINPLSLRFSMINPNVVDITSPLDYSRTTFTQHPYVTLPQEHAHKSLSSLQIKYRFHLLSNRSWWTELSTGRCLMKQILTNPRIPLTLKHSSNSARYTTIRRCMDSTTTPSSNCSLLTSKTFHTSSSLCWTMFAAGCTPQSDRKMASSSV